MQWVLALMLALFMEHFKSFGHFHVTRVTYFDHSMNTILTYLL